MKSAQVVFLLLFAVCICLQVQNIRANEETVERITWAGNTFEVHVNALDSWQTGTVLEVIVRLTLVQMDTQGKGAEYVTYNPYYWNPSFFELTVRGGKNYTTRDGERPILWVSEELLEHVNFTKVGDYWEKKLDLGMDSWAAEKLGRGEIAYARLSVGFSLREYGANQTFLNDANLGASITVVVFRPLLSTTETIAVGGVGAFMLVGLLTFASYKLGWISICRWGYHDWKGCGERVVVHRTCSGTLLKPASREPSIVFSERRCSRCGLMQKRRFSRSRDGFLEVVGVEDVGFTPT